MTIFITQGRYTQQAIKGLVATPEDRMEQVRGLMKAAGVKLLSYYVTFGEYDFMVIGEGDASMTDFAAALMVASAGGGVTDLKSTVAITSAEAKTAFTKAGSMAAGFKAAGQG
ncbi:MAG TPA: GYD domain-containing protein [Methylomirabilota bacterium]|nr:GYD domain-containing protein [Methylomirabilota bacterium]